MGLSDRGLVWCAPGVADGWAFEEQITFSKRLHDILSAWRGTPYMVGQGRKGVGSDCVRFVCGVLDELLHKPQRDVTTLPPDAAWHNPVRALESLNTIMDLYRPVVSVTNARIEPADIIIVGPRRGGPGHALIVGSGRNELWEASPGGVLKTGLGFTDTVRIFDIFRIVERRVACS